MATYIERAALWTDIREEVQVAFFEDLTKTLQAKPPADAEAHKRQRVRQRWAASAINNADNLTVTLSKMVASSASDDKLAGGLDDTEIKRLVGKAIDALASVELKAETETLPV